jgi:hypothetical protein
MGFLRLEAQISSGFEVDGVETRYGSSRKAPSGFRALFEGAKEGAGSRPCSRSRPYLPRGVEDVGERGVLAFPGKYTPYTQ